MVFGRVRFWPVISGAFETQEQEFAGCLSALYVGDDLAAVHAGMRSDRAWHWWFPVYEDRYAKYSPGLILLLDVAREAARLGLDYLDLGKGDDPYKQSFTNAEIRPSEGNAALMPIGNRSRPRCVSVDLVLPSPRPALRRANQWLRQRRW
jgi:CelD/BcsL family acetyltransferase involved in cellulose biosynthesis